MGFFSTVWQAVKGFFVSFWKAIKRLFEAIVNFFEHIVNYFKNLALNKNKHKPFVADLEKLKDEIRNAPIRDCGIFEGVYNEETDEIEHTRIIETDELDAKTRSILNGDPLVVLN